MISRGGFDAYTAMVDEQGEQAVARIRDFAGRLEWGSTPDSRATARQLLRDYAYDVVTSYGDNAAAIAAEYYDTLAALAGRDLPDAVMAAPPTAEGVAASVDWATRSVWDRGEDGGLAAVDAASVAQSVADMARGRVRRAANDTMWTNADRDGERFARVTTSTHPCAFCLMLASAGFVYTSERTALWAHNMRKYHDDCTCTAVASFDDEGLEGYGDTVDEYWNMWKDSAKTLPDSETREMWSGMSDAEKAAYQRPDHPTWNPYANFRTHMLLSRLRDNYGLES